MNTIKKKDGFTLVEMMVVAGLLGGLALVSTSIFKNMSVNQKTAENKNDQLLIQAEIIGLLSEPENCRQNFINAAFATTTARTLLRDSNNNVRFQTNTSIGTSNIQIASMRLVQKVNPDAQRRAKSSLFIEFNNGRAGLRQFSTREIVLFTELDTSNNIINCRSLSNESDIWQRQNSNMANIEYAGGEVLAQNGFRANGSLAGCNADNAGKMAYNVSENLYEFCDGSNIVKFQKACPNNNEIWMRIDGIYQCINLADANCRAQGKQGFDRSLLKECSNFKCGRIDCLDHYYDSLVDCNGIAAGQANGSVVTVSGYYKNKHSARSSTHHWVSGNYKCVDSQWILQSGSAHTPDNSLPGVRDAQAL